jgi:3-methyladenine DNA glycosylase AlkD
MSVLDAFERYQKARVLFAQNVADLSVRAATIETMQDAGVMQLLRPLLLDNVPSIQQSAALALGRLANHSDDLAEAVVGNEILPQLVYSLAEQNRFYKKQAAFVLRSVAKHSPELAQAVVESGALEALVPCLEEFDPSVKEGAAWALGYIAQHTPELAQNVVDSGAVPLLVLCVQEPEISLKRIATSALSDIAKHSPELAQAVVDAGAVSYLAPLVHHPDARLKRQVCSCLAQVAKHSVDLAEVVVEAEVFPKILDCLKDLDKYVRKNSATCIREVAKHTPELAKLIVNAGGAAALVDYVSGSRANARLPGIMALGYISAFSETLALAVIVSKGIVPLRAALIEEKEDHIKAAAAWSLGQIGRHTTDHAAALAEAGVLRHLLELMLDDGASEDLHVKSKRALECIVKKCPLSSLHALDSLLKSDQAPIDVQKTVLLQFKKLLPNDVQARRDFVETGGLQYIQEIAEKDEGGEVAGIVEEVNRLFPEEIVNYYSPHYAKKLMDQISDHRAEFPTK